MSMNVIHLHIFVQAYLLQLRIFWWWRRLVLNHLLFPSHHTSPHLTSPHIVYLLHSMCYWSLCLAISLFSTSFILLLPFICYSLSSPTHYRSNRYTSRCFSHLLLTTPHNITTHNSSDLVSASRVDLKEFTALVSTYVRYITRITSISTSHNTTQHKKELFLSLLLYFT